MLDWADPPCPHVKSYTGENPRSRPVPKLAGGLEVFENIRLFLWAGPELWRLLSRTENLARTEMQHLHWNAKIAAAAMVAGIRKPALAAATWDQAAARLVGLEICLTTLPVASGSSNRVATSACAMMPTSRPWSSTTGIRRNWRWDMASSARC